MCARTLLRGVPAGLDPAAPSPNDVPIVQPQETDRDPPRCGEPHDVARPTETIQLPSERNRVAAPAQERSGVRARDMAFTSCLEFGPLPKSKGQLHMLVPQPLD